MGTPVGRAPFVRSELNAKFDKLQAALEKLECLGDPQAAAHILRSCLGAAKVIHLLRTATYEECAMMAKKMQALLVATWGTIIGTGIPDINWTLASLPVRLGGLGATDPVVIHPQAALASFLNAATGRAGLPLTRLDHDLHAAVDSLCITLPAMAQPLQELWTAGSLPELLEDPIIESWTQQKVWSMAAHEALAKAFDRDASDRLERLRNLNCGANGSAWVTNLPLEHDGCTTFTADERQVLARFRLGLPFPNPTECGGHIRTPSATTPSPVKRAGHTHVTTSSATP